MSLGPPTTTGAPIVDGDPRSMALAPVLDTRIAWWEVGQGRPVLFLHGNPTSSFLWRHVIPPVSLRARCLAPDLAGMGRSDPMPDDDYSYLEHRRYLDAWIELMRFDEPLVLVVHDWGSVLGMDYARRNPGKVAGIVHMEAIIAERRYSDWRPQAAEWFAAIRSAQGEKLIIEDNLFIESILPSGVLRRLTPVEHDVYRHPFRAPARRRPTLVWPRELPVEGKPETMVRLIAANARFMRDSDMPKHLIVAEPGSMVKGAILDECRKWRNQSESSARGMHFMAEDSPREIAAAVDAFLDRLEDKR
ncbi:MAG: haloalkane dehalogenase [Reyranellaceae bacterium]